ncbi:MAG: ydjI [Anaerocolumna sp.]|jgi:membrane protease subunit (stomatin/prohibitin family)|nr:ydjI [Anaerocolumna sp.]
MGFFTGQLSNVVEWEEFREDMLFWKWSNREIKKGSKLILRPGQDAVFLFNGKSEGIFTDDGSYDIESEIIPFLSTLSGFKFGFNSGMRAEVLFINTKEFTVKWGTKNAINIPTPSLPGGLPIRANGTFQFRISDYIRLIDKVAGIKDIYLVEDVKLRITSLLDQLLNKWIVKEGKDLFHLQANSFDIGEGIKTDLDMQLFDIGLSVTGFQIMSFTYPDQIQDMINKNASVSMIGDMGRYQQAAMTEGLTSGKLGGGGIASDMAGMVMGINLAGQVMNNMNATPNPSPSVSFPGTGHPDSGYTSGQTEQTSSQKPNFCPNCGQKTGNTNFCPNCGNKLV